MKAGQLDQRVTLQKPSTERDDYGQQINAWTTLGEAWAAVEPLQGREFLAAGAEQSEVTARIRMRWRSNIAANMRVLHGTDTYNIQTCIHVKSGRDELHLMVKRLA